MWATHSMISLSLSTIRRRWVQYLRLEPVPNQIRDEGVSHASELECTRDVICC